MDKINITTSPETKNTNLWKTIYENCKHKQGRKYKVVRCGLGLASVFCNDKNCQKLKAIAAWKNIREELKNDIS